MKSSDETLKQFRDLLRQKRRLLDKMKRHRKSLAKGRVEKKKLNEAISRMRRSGFAFAGLSTIEAKSRVETEIRAVTTQDIYLRDLEKKFDKLEQSSEVKYRGATVDIDDIDDAPTARVRSDDDEGVYAVHVDPETGIVDFSEQGSQGEEEPEEPGPDYAIE